MLISVIVPVYNTEKYVGKTLDSLINQTYKDLEIIVVDDGSPDNAAEIVQQYALKDSRIKLVRQQNMGLSGARNTGIDLASGEFIVFIDSDDSAYPDLIENLLKTITLGDYSCVYSVKYNKYYEDGDRRVESFLFGKSLQIENPLEYAFEVLIKKCRGFRSHSHIYNASIIKENNIRFPVGHTSEDFPFNLDFLSHAKKIGFYEGTSIDYLKRPGSITSSFDSKFFNTALFLHKKALEFLNTNNNGNWDTDRAASTLLCLIMVPYITKAMSPKNKMTSSEKKEFLRTVMANKVVASAFKSDPYPPYSNKIIVMYYKIMYTFLKQGNLSMAKFMATLCSIIR